MRHCGKDMESIGHGLRCSVCGKTLEWGKKSDQEKKKDKKEEPTE